MSAKEYIIINNILDVSIFFFTILILQMGQTYIEKFKIKGQSLKNSFMYFQRLKDS